MSTAVRQANEKPEPDGLWFDFSSGEWIRTTDLRVMRDFPGFGTFFTQAPHFSLAWGTLFWRGRRIFGYELL